MSNIIAKSILVVVFASLIAFVLLVGLSVHRQLPLKDCEEIDTVWVGLSPEEVDSLEHELERYNDPKTYEDDEGFSEKKMREAERQLDFDACYNRDPLLRQRLRDRGFGFW